MHYQLRGSGEPLVLVHGSWGDHHNWDAVVPRLAERFTVLTFDRRGHSRSERPEGQGSVREDTADLAALIEHLGLAPAHVAGNSFGASIVLRLGGERPELLRSLVAHEPPLFELLAGDEATAPMLDEIRRRVAPVVELLERGANEQAAELFVETIALGPGSWQGLPPELRETFVFNAPTWLDETRDPESLTLDLDRLRAFPHSALLTDGDQSPPSFRPVVERLAQILPRAVRDTIAGAGHIPHVTHPERYVERVTRFATRVAAG